MTRSEPYIVFPGEGRASPELPRVFLFGRSLAHLYLVWFRDCIVIQPNPVEPYLLHLATEPGYIHLHPREDGLYPPALPKEYRMSRCIITGCALINPEDGNLHVWGDLHEQGDQYIFNGCRGVGGDPLWNPEPLPPHTKIIQLLDDNHYFERQAIFVVDKEYAELNPLAESYIHG
jgi:hypothetical protein